ncbi:unnamed protein product [Albugo candida]|uniref:Uncharacterized protein n=1 Tax=Albugo candida TaxID=65357 RepID=A0A024FV29_9STRA|nr:unnamed protein product [Albugo candida]|eukprot:CCI10792.1 unnamed protein product [Albugo candida]
MSCCSTNTVSGRRRVCGLVIDNLREGEFSNSLSFSSLMTRHIYAGDDLAWDHFSFPFRLDAYCMCTCSSIATNMKRLTADFVGFMAFIASGDAALCLERKESSFV